MGFGEGLDLSVHWRVLLDIVFLAIGFPDTFTVTVIKMQKKPHHSLEMFITYSALRISASVVSFAFSGATWSVPRVFA